MPKPFQSVPVKPGGLITNTDPQQIGFGNYSTKCDFRRVFEDRDARREGHTWFFPKPDGNRTNQSTLPGGLPVTLLAMARRADGKVIIVGGNQTTLYRFVALEDLSYFSDTSPYFDPNDANAPYFKSTYNEWEVIGSGFSASGERWQAVEVNNTLVLNNAVDLLVTFGVEDESVTPIYELRDNGVVSVGTIAEHNGILICGDIRQLKEIAPIRNDGLTLAIDGLTMANTGIGTINLGYRDIENFTYTTVTPATDTPPVEGVDYTVDTDLGVVHILTTYWADRLRLFQVSFSGAMLGPFDSVTRSTTPYETITDQTLYDRFENRVLWSMPGLPRRFAAAVPGTIDAGSAFLSFGFLSKSFTAGQQVIVIGAGLNGGNLLATILQIANYTNDFGNTAVQVYLDSSAAVSVTNATVQAFDSIGSIVGFEDLDDEGGAVLAMMTLRDQFIVYKERSIFIATYTGQATSPFNFGRPVYQGEESIFYKNTLTPVLDKANGYDALYGGGESHFYVGREGFYRFNLITRAPVRIAQEVENLFFDVARGADPNLIFCSNNAITKEIFLCYPNTAPAAVTITSLQKLRPNSNIADAVTQTAHNLSVGQLANIVVNAPGDTGYAGIFPVSSVISATEFQYILPNSNVSNTCNVSGGCTVAPAVPVPCAICFDYKYGTISTTGAAYTAAATLQVPTADIPTQAQFWFMMGTSGGLVLQYGLSPTNQWSGKNNLFDRLGSDYVCVTQSGFGHVGAENSDTEINSYTIKVKSFPQFMGVGILVLQNDGSIDGLNYNYSTNLTQGTDPRKELPLPLMTMGVGIADSITVYKAGDQCEVLSKEWKAREVLSDGFGRTP